jgi:hypothetical protein
VGGGRQQDLVRRKRTETKTSRGYKSSCVFIEVVLLCSRFLKCGTFIEVCQRKVKIDIKENIKRFYIFIFFLKEFS